MSRVNTTLPLAGDEPAEDTGRLSRLAEALRTRLRSSEIWFTALAAMLGVLAGAMTVGLQLAAHAIQALLYGLDLSERLSTQTSLTWIQLLALPAGGATLALFTFVVRARRRALVDAVELALTLGLEGPAIVRLVEIEGGDLRVGMIADEDAIKGDVLSIVLLCQRTA